MKVINAESYEKLLLTLIRDKTTKTENLREAMVSIGRIMGQKIYGDHFTENIEVETPLHQSYSGVVVKLATVVILSTRDDADYFATGIASVFDGSLRGYMDFGGARGPAALSAPVQAVNLPAPPTGQTVNVVIIAKSVLATGCTAVSLANKALEYYRPEKLFVASTFYSQRGIDEINQQIYPRPEIYVFGEPDGLNSEGMLYPGVGNLDKRLSS
jgi:uracil phosphoribosyltransferase